MYRNGTEKISPRKSATREELVLFNEGLLHHPFVRLRIGSGASAKRLAGNLGESSWNCSISPGSKLEADWFACKGGNETGSVMVSWMELMAVQQIVEGRSWNDGEISSKGQNLFREHKCAPWDE